ncbi:efflux RND transporter periplasmic adaptor subunit [Sphingomonas oligophenolica]|uniref:Efflux RND transporter periplasmic adaptor subunit n=1 Tax=Sphingomonas oligophenolica TaxID=301154 RepID=A0ABU9Y4D1_9SPHN
MKRARFWLIALLVLAAAAGGYFFWRGQPRAVTTAAARIGPAVQLVYATGFVEAEQPVSVSARLTAPVAQVLVREGDRVRRGEALVLLDDEDQRSLLAQAAAQSLGARLAEQRTLALYAKGWVTRAARDSAVATADAARAAEATARAHVGQAVVRAGIDGVVLRRDVENGDLAVPSRVLMLLGDPARVRVTATVDERDVPGVHVGQTALLSSDAWPGRILRGHVSVLTPGGDPNQRAFRARLLLDDAPTMPVGMTLEVNIVTRRVDHAVLVPATALAGDHVWVLDQGRAVSRRVRTGIVGTEEAQIETGVRAGETLIVTPPADLRAGERVAPGPPVAAAPRGPPAMGAK